MRHIYIILSAAILVILLMIVSGIRSSYVNLGSSGFNTGWPVSMVVENSNDWGPLPIEAQVVPVVYVFVVNFAIFLSIFEFTNYITRKYKGIRKGTAVT